MANATPAAASSDSEQDPSMEEILQSIRRIIAEDGDEASPALHANAADVPGSDVLELTEMLKEDGSVESLKSSEEPATKTAAAPGDVLAGIDAALQSPLESVEPVMSEKPIAEPISTPLSASAPAPDSLLSGSAAAAAASSLKKIISTPTKPQPTPQVPFRSGYTVEDLVLESLKPMLKQWLDDNLPQMVERIVEREIRKLAE